MRAILVGLATAAVALAAGAGGADARTINCGGNTGYGWKRVPEQGGGIWRVLATNTGCRAARRVASRSYPNDGGGPYQRWSYRGWRCREVATDWEYSKVRCTRAGQRVVWEAGS